MGSLYNIYFNPHRFLPSFHSQLFQISRSQALTIDDSGLGGPGATGGIEVTQAGYGPAVAVAVSTNGAGEWSTPTISDHIETITGSSNEETDTYANANENIATFEYHPPFLLGSLDPPTGPAIGGTVVSISLATSGSDNGTVFADSGSAVSVAGGNGSTSEVAQWQFSFDPIRDVLAKCFFNGTVVQATVVSNTTVECVAPPTIANGGVTFVAVSVNGVEVASGGGGVTVAGDAGAANGAGTLEFFYLPDEAEMQLFPASGPVKGGTIVEVSSRHIADAAAALFLHQSSGNSLDDGHQNASTINDAAYPLRLPPSSAMCSFSSNVDSTGTGTPVVSVVPASELSFHWDGIVGQDGRETGVGHVLCQTPPAPDNLPSPVTVQLSLNGGRDFTNHGAQFYYRPEAYVFGVEPAFGPVTGGNPVRVEGAAFRDEGRPGGRSDEMVLCRFGDQEIGATVHTAGLISCLAPPMPSVPERQDVEVRLNLFGSGGFGSLLCLYGYLSRSP